MVVDDTITAHLLLLGILDTEKELAKLGKKREDLMGKLQVRALNVGGMVCCATCHHHHVQALDTKMASGDYVARTPEDVRNMDAERHTKLTVELAEVEQHLKDMQDLASAA